jgi:hypothetical protein
MRKTLCQKCNRLISNNNYNKHTKACDGTYFLGPVNPTKYKNKGNFDLKAHLAKVRPNSREDFVPWNKGLTKETDIRIKQGAETYKSKNYSFIPTEETKEKIRQANLRNPKRRLKRNRILYKDTYLDSTYELELAKILDKNNIMWERPSSIRYLGEDKNYHNYFPDFYLPEYDLYLDPKNDYLIQTQSKKIELAAHQNNVNIIILRKDDISSDFIKTLLN